MDAGAGAAKMSKHPPPVYIMAAWEKRMADAYPNDVSMKTLLIARKALHDALIDAQNDFNIARETE